MPGTVPGLGDSLSNRRDVVSDHGADNFMGCVSLLKDVLKILVKREFGAIRPILDN